MNSEATFSSILASSQAFQQPSTDINRSDVRQHPTRNHSLGSSAIIVKVNLEVDLFEFQPCFEQREPYPSMWCPGFAKDGASVAT
jgi:hypothetical protein